MTDSCWVVNLFDLHWVWRSFTVFAGRGVELGLNLGLFSAANVISLVEDNVLAGVTPPFHSLE